MLGLLWSRYPHRLMFCWVEPDEMFGDFRHTYTHTNRHTHTHTHRHQHNKKKDKEILRPWTNDNRNFKEKKKNRSSPTDFPVGRFSDPYPTGRFTVVQWFGGSVARWFDGSNPPKRPWGPRAGGHRWTVKTFRRQPIRPEWSVSPRSEVYWNFGNFCDFFSRVFRVFLGFTGLFSEIL